MIELGPPVSWPGLLMTEFGPPNICRRLLMMEFGPPASWEGLLNTEFGNIWAGL